MSKLKSLWTPAEDAFLEAMIFRQVPYPYILEHLPKRTNISITRRVSMYGLVEVRELYRKDAFNDLTKILDGPLPSRKTRTEALQWSKKSDIFLRKAYYLNYSYKDIADELGIFWGTVRRRILKLGLKEKRERFYKRYAGIMSLYLERNENGTMEGV